MTEHTPGPSVGQKLHRVLGLGPYPYDEFDYPPKTGGTCQECFHVQQIQAMSNPMEEANALCFRHTKATKGQTP